jgi:hypothetical protein
VVPRSNFDNIAFACISVFQMLTTSDFGDVLFPAMRGAGPIAAVYLIALIGLGNWMLLNLFLAIIITGFSETKAQVCSYFTSNLHCIQHTPHSTLHTPHSTLHTPHSTLHTAYTSQNFPRPSSKTAKKHQLCIDRF